VYCIALLNETVPDIPQKFRTDVVLADTETGKTFSEKVRLVYLQLPFFEKKEEECVTNLDKWIYNLKHMESLTRLPFGVDGGVFKMLDEVTDVDSLNKEERREYEHTLKVFRDLRGAMDGADLKGYRRGMEKGIEKGKLEEKLLIARNLKASGVPIDTIRQATNLTDEEIQNL
jgi:predicted transposase/invertase (TIGR01784 family)